ncbi:MAG: prephenate dehydratase, partial [Bacteroidales bacterium]
IFGLEILAESIETNKTNYTRFMMIQKEDRPRAVEGINKASLSFSLPHEEGSLASVLAILSYYKLNLTKIESMPILGQEFEYHFHIDIVFTHYEKYKQGIQAISPLIRNLKIMGEYCKAEKISTY